MEQETFEELGSCPVCQGGSLSPFIGLTDHSVSGERFEVVRCGGCGFCFTNPRPGPRIIGRYYQSDTYISHAAEAGGAMARLYRLARGVALRRKRGLIARIVPDGAILDVGCGTGEFLAAMRAGGYRVMGVEPSAKARSHAIADHRINVVPTLDQVPEGQFDVITLWHVLEHMHDPGATLKKLHPLMRPGGLLLIAVPDRESWDQKYYGSNWAAWDVPRHLSHFRRQDVVRLLEQEGFRPTNVHPMYLDALYVSMLSEQYRGRSGLGAGLLGLLVGIRSNWVALLSGRPTSSLLYVARKV